jgi:hypothetical protein
MVKIWAMAINAPPILPLLKNSINLILGLGVCAAEPDDLNQQSTETHRVVWSEAMQFSVRQKLIAFLDTGVLVRLRSYTNGVFGTGGVNFS